MIHPFELQLDLPMEIANSSISTMHRVWNMLAASKNGILERIKLMADECPDLLFAQYNYTPPIYFAVREGHVDVVRYLLQQGAHDPEYKNYPFQERLQTIAIDQGLDEIAFLLDEYVLHPSLQKYKGDNGAIHYNRSQQQQEFEDAVLTNNIKQTEEILKNHPEYAIDETFFWGEGILMKPVQHRKRELTEVLMQYGAKVPSILKWAQAYYFKFYDSASHIMVHDRNPNTMSWHHVTILHDMAQKGFIDKAELLIRHGADINPIDEEYLSTPLGMAVRWGQIEMVEYLIMQGADIHASGAPWSNPLAWAKQKEYPEIERLLRDKGAIN